MTEKEKLIGQILNEVSILKDELDLVYDQQRKTDK